jgi:vacuolar-type H+-ATPase subunit C/Vma6
MSKIQYTIRNIPPAVDKVIKKRSKQSGKSFNQTVVDLLSLQTFGTATPPSDEGFDWLFGAGKDSLGKEFDEAIEDMSKPDPSLWK